MGTSLGGHIEIYCRWLPRDILKLSSGAAALVSRQYFPGIEDVLRIERLFQRAHGVDRLNPEFGLKIFLLALADAVLAGAGPAHRLRPLHQAMHEVLAARHLLTIVHVAH